MNVVRAIFERRSASTLATTPAAWLLDALGGNKTASGQRITPSTAEGIPVVFACVGILGDTVGQLPLKLFRSTDEGKAPATTHSLYTVLHDLSNPFMTAIEFRQVMMRWLALWGNAYAEIERDKQGNVRGLWPLATDRMTVSKDHGTLKYSYRTSNGTSREWWWDNPDNPPVFHLKINSLDGYTGRSPVTVLRESLGITRAADEHAARFFGNGALPDIILSKKGPGVMKPSAKQNFIESWKEKFGGSAKAHGIALLEEEFTVTPITMPLKDAQFLEVRSFQIEDGARMFRIPLFMLQHTTGQTSWGSGIEQMMLGAINLSFMPWFVLWEQAIARDLLTKKSFNTHFAKFLVQGLMRGDSAQRAAYYKSMHEVGALSTNEIRDLDEMNTIGPDGDRRFVSTNLQSLAAPVVGSVESAPAA